MEEAASLKQLAAGDTSSIRISSYSMFDDDVWILDTNVRGRPYRTINWKSVTLADGSILTSAKRRSLLHTCKYFLLLCKEGAAGKRRTPPRSAMVFDLFHNLRALLEWLSKRGVYSLADLRMSHLTNYRNYVYSRKAKVKTVGGVYSETAKAISPHMRFVALMVVRYLTRLQGRIPDGPSLDLRTVERLLASPPPEREKATERIPDATFVSLMNSSIAWLRDVAPELLALESEYRTAKSKAVCFNSYNALYRAKERKARIVVVAGESVNLSSFTYRPYFSWLTFIVTACFIIIAGLTGMRACEVLSLKTGCLKVVPAEDGRKLLKLSGMLYKTSDLQDGEPADWVAGWDEPTNPIKLAVGVVESLQERFEASEGFLFTSLMTKQTRALGLSRAAIQEQINRFAQLHAVTGWHFAPHQFRKTFARFVALSAPNGALALQRHFKHVSTQMTEQYFPTDPELWDEIIEAQLELAEEKLDLLLGSDKLAGIRGREVLARNTPYRGEAGAAARAEMVRLTMLDSSAVVVLHVYGVCLYEASTAKCKGNLVNVGLNVCLGCSNLAIDGTHEPFWIEEETAAENRIAELQTIGQRSLSLEAQRDAAKGILGALRG